MYHTEGMLISELAATTGVSVHAIRSYLAEGLIPRAGKTDGGFGLFDRNAVERLGIIRLTRQAGLPLQAIRPLLHAMNGKDAIVVATSIEEVERTLQQCRQQLAALSAQILVLRDAASSDDLRRQEVA